MCLGTHIGIAQHLLVARKPKFISEIMKPSWGFKIEKARSFRRVQVGRILILEIQFSLIIFSITKLFFHNFQGVSWNPHWDYSIFTNRPEAEINFRNNEAKSGLQDGKSAVSS